MQHVVFFFFFPKGFASSALPAAPTTPSQQPDVVKRALSFDETRFNFSKLLDG